MATDFDPVVYRLRLVPYAYRERSEVAILLSQTLAIPLSDIRIHSLASAEDGISTRSTRTATVMFKTQPPAVQNHMHAREWELTCPSSQKTLKLDSHFKGMTPLNDVVSPNEHKYNCIAISGLSSHAFGSWQPRGGAKKFMWLRDALPERVPDTKTWIYGYSTELCDNTSFQNIPDLADSLIDHLLAEEFVSPSAPRIIILAHSLGGIVFKQAIANLARSSERAVHIINLVQGAIMFGVPNMGMEQAHLLSLVKGQPNEDLIEDLALSSKYLDNLDRQFFGHQVNQNLKVFWAYETRTSSTAIRGTSGSISMTGPQMVLVSRESATSNRIESDRASTFPINENHSNMVKFSEDDPMCKVVLKKLSLLVDPESSHPSVLPVCQRASTSTMRNTSGIPNPESLLTQATDDGLALNISQPLMLASIDVPELHHRLEQIVDRSDYTFQWIFENDELGFIRWLRSGKEPYWIRGKPGSGKSTLMKFIYMSSETRRTLEDWTDCHLVLAAFFFHHRGSVLQKSLEGLLRSILVSILRQHPQVAAALNPIVEESGKITFPCQEAELETFFRSYTWTKSSLWKALMLILHQRDIKFRMCFFLDALDEYDGPPDVIRDFLDALIQGSRGSISTLKICFSSRPWGSFMTAFSGWPGLTIHDHTTSDITYYCSQVLDTNMLVANILKDLVPDIVANANGVFLWARLALKDLVDIANTTHDVHKLRRHLQEIPRELYTYYVEILKRSPQYLRIKAYALLEIVTRAYEPLSVSEAYHILCSSEKTDFRSAKIVSQDDRSENDIFNHGSTAINSACGGLLEITQSSRRRGRRVVQHMHQTVREFVLDPRFKTLALDRLARLRFENGHSFLAKYMLVRGQIPLGNTNTQALRHCKDAELTTGRSQLNFLQTVPSEWRAQWATESPEHDIFVLALQGGLHLCLDELLSLKYQTDESRKLALARFMSLVVQADLNREDFLQSLKILERARFMVEGLERMVDKSLLPKPELDFTPLYRSPDAYDNVFNTRL